MTDMEDMDLNGIDMDMSDAEKPQITNLIRMTFGQHNGKTLRNVPPTYLAWLIGKGLDESEDPGVKELGVYLKKNKGLIKKAARD